MDNSISIIIPGAVRIKKNSRRIYGFGKFKKSLPSEAYVEWEKQARADFIMNHRRFPVITTECHVCATIFYKGQRPDLSGAMESIGDCLEGLVWENDRLIESWDGTRLIKDNKNPRTVVVVEWEDI